MKHVIAAPPLFFFLDCLLRGKGEKAMGMGWEDCRPARSRGSESDKGPQIKRGGGGGGGGLRRKKYS